MNPTKYILRDSTDVDGRPSYFMQMTMVGPMLTSDPGKAQVFDSEEEANIWAKSSSNAVCNLTVEPQPE